MYVAVRGQLVALFYCVGFGLGGMCLYLLSHFSGLTPFLFSCRPWLAQDSLFRPDCLWAHRDPLASAPAVLGLKVCGSIPLSSIFNRFIYLATLTFPKHFYVLNLTFKVRYPCCRAWREKHCFAICRSNVFFFIQIPILFLFVLFVFLR